MSGSIPSSPRFLNAVIIVVLAGKLTPAASVSVAKHALTKSLLEEVLDQSLVLRQEAGVVRRDTSREQLDALILRIQRRDGLVVQRPGLDDGARLHLFFSCE